MKTLEYHIISRNTTEVGEEKTAGLVNATKAAVDEPRESEIHTHPHI